MENKNQEFFKKVNEAFANSDVNFLVENAADDINWTVIGDFTLNGKDEVEAKLKEMGQSESLGLTMGNIIVNGDLAAAEGTLAMPDGKGGSKTYAFCDVYKLEQGKIKNMTSYVVEKK